MQREARAERAISFDDGTNAANTSANDGRRANEAGGRTSCESRRSARALSHSKARGRFLKDSRRTERRKDRRREMLSKLFRRKERVKAAEEVRRMQVMERVKLVSRQLLY